MTILNLNLKQIKLILKSITTIELLMTTLPSCFSHCSCWNILLCVWHFINCINSHICTFYHVLTKPNSLIKQPNKQSANIKKKTVNANVKLNNFCNICRKIFHCFICTKWTCLRFLWSDFMTNSISSKLWCATTCFQMLCCAEDSKFNGQLNYSSLVEWGLCNES